jgi:hypothetical protein
LRSKFLDNSSEVFQFLSMFNTVTSAHFYRFAVPAITLLGLSKGGLSALGGLGVADPFVGYLTR